LPSGRAAAGGVKEARARGIIEGGTRTSGKRRRISRPGGSGDARVGRLRNTGGSGSREPRVYERVVALIVR